MVIGFCYYCAFNKAVHIMTSTTPNLKRWNWGAFFLTWVWGIGNRTYLGFLAFLGVVVIATFKAILINYLPSLTHGFLFPALNILTLLFMIAIHVLHGLFGSRWSWENKDWKSVAAFKRAQTIWGVIGFLGWIAFIAGFVAIFTAATNSKTYKESIAIAKFSPSLQLQIGEPITVSPWTLRGGVHFAGEAGRAYYKFKAIGPNGSAVVTVMALKERGVWTIKEELAVVPHDTLGNTSLLLFGKIIKY